MRSLYGAASHASRRADPCALRGSRPVARGCGVQALSVHLVDLARAQDADHGEQAVCLAIVAGAATAQQENGVARSVGAPVIADPDRRHSA